MDSNRFALIALALSLSAPSTVALAAPDTDKASATQQRRVDKAVETAALATCKLEWIRTGNKSRTAVFAFMAGCIDKATSATASTR